MNKNDEVEYCNLELRFDRQHIQDLIKDLIQKVIPYIGARTNRSL